MCRGCNDENHALTDGLSRSDFLKISGAAGAAAFFAGGVPAFAQGDTSSVKSAVSSASDEYGVPEELLLAMGFVNTLWEMPPASITEYDPGDLHGRGEFGFMQLAQNPESDSLGRAASLTDLTEKQLKNERAANIRGGAAVLKDLAGGETPTEIDGWMEAVEAYAGPDYVEEVWGKMREGASLTTSSGEKVTLEPTEVEVFRTPARRGRGTDYKGAYWRPAYSGNYRRANRERSHNIKRVVVHVVQGSYSGAVNWFQNPQSQVSAHYVVKREGKIAQCVRHKDIAYHAGNWSYNVHSIGIEHAGWGNDRSTWTDTMYRASARLTAYICRRHNIRVTDVAIIGHRNVPGGTSSCPGRYFDFNRYRRMVSNYL